jgi:hypothetical protein
MTLKDRRLTDYFIRQVDAMTLAQVEELAEDIWETWKRKNSNEEKEKLDYCLRRRQRLLHDGFRLTDEEFARFGVVAEMLIDKTRLIHRNASWIYREAWERMKSGGGDFSDFELKAAIRVVYDGEESVFDMEDDSGSDYVKFAEILEDFYSDLDYLQPMCHEPGYDSDATLDDDFFYSMFGCDFDDDHKIDTTWHDWLGHRFPRLTEVPVCHALHNLFDHTHYSLPDIIRINDVWSEVSVKWQNFYPYEAK